MEILSALLGAMMIFGLVTLFCLSRTLWRREPAAEGQEDCLPALPWQDPELLLFTVLSGAAWICACVMHTVPVMTAVSDLILISGMTVLAYIDRRHHIVPNRLLLALLVLWLSVCGIGVIFDPETGIGYVLSGIAGAVIAGAAFLLCYLLSARQLGGGDVKLSEVMGLYLTGARVMGAVTYGVVLCCLYTVVQLIRRRITLKDGIPLVPFLYIGTLLVCIVVGG